MKKVILSFITGLMFFSCTKIVQIDIEQTKPKLVINGLFNTDSIWEVEISLSRYIYHNTPLELIDDAIVTIKDSDNNSYDLNNQGDGIYTSITEKPIIGKQYTIEVFHPSHDDVNAINQLPSSIAITNLDWQEQVLVDGELKRNVKITFQDSPENDYYVLRLFAHSWEVEFIDTIYEQQPVYFSSQNAAIENKNDNGFYSSTNFTDALFNGDEYVMDVLVDEYYFTGEKEEFRDKGYGIDSISIVFSKVSFLLLMYASISSSSNSPIISVIDEYIIFPVSSHTLYFLEERDLATP